MKAKSRKTIITLRAQLASRIHGMRELKGLHMNLKNYSQENTNLRNVVVSLENEISLLVAHLRDSSASGQEQPLGASQVQNNVKTASQDSTPPTPVQMTTGSVAMASTLRDGPDQWGSRSPGAPVELHQVKVSGGSPGKAVWY